MVLVLLVDNTLIILKNFRYDRGKKIIITITKYKGCFNHFVYLQTLNELTGNGRHSGTMMWASSEFEFRSTKPSFSQKYNVSMPWHDRVETSISWLLNEEKPVNFLCMYFEQPDSASHYFGVHSNEVNEQLKRVDDILQYILRKLTIHNLEKQVNLIILSDHGMIDIDKSNIINITQILGKDSIKCGTSPVLQIAMKPGKYKHEF